jgi:serpin B
MIRFVILAALFLSACSSAELVAPEGSLIDPPRDGIGAKDHRASDTRALTAAYNASGHELFKRLAGTPGNIVFSPHSIGTAMAMVLSGARGESETEMVAVLRHTLKRSEIANANVGVQAVLNAYNKSAALPAGRSARLRVANALITKGAGNLAPSYEALLKDKYAAEIFRNAGVDEINAWVSKRTEGKIGRIFDQLDPTTALVLVNAVYFKATWQRTFSKAHTTDQDFNVSSSAKIKVPTMHQRGHFPVMARPGYRAIRLPYSVTPLSMVIVLPDTIGGATALAARLDPAEMANMFAGLNVVRDTELAMPRFKAKFKTSLVGAFQEMGMKQPFDPGRADFSGVTGRPRSEALIAIDQIIHSAVIEVDEAGTEAAAATGVSAVVVSAPAQAEPFTIDRPFLFYITDDATGAILFQGRISDPRKD